MPYMKNGRRDYKRENALYNAKPEQLKNRAKRNAARSAMIKSGKAAKGDGKDIGHRKALSRGGSNSLANLFVQTKSSNRSFSRKANGAMKSEVSKKGR